MIESYLLEQLVAVKKHGTLVAAAEALCITQPALSKSMKKFEDIMCISLFSRTNRKIELNETGKFFAEKAERYLEQGESMLSQVYNFDRSQHNISFGACAPAPIWDICPILTSFFPGMSITSKMESDEELLRGLDRNNYQLIALSYEPHREDFYVYKYKTEKLFLSVPQSHPLSSKTEVYPQDLEGEFVLVYTDIGIWYDWLKENLHGIHLLMMEDANALKEAIGLGAALSFVSDNALRFGYQDTDQKVIPIIAPETTISFFLVCNKKDYSTYRKVFQKLSQQKANH